MFIVEPGDRFGGPDARDHVLALGVDQVVAEELVLAGVRVAGERHAGARVVPGVAEHHGLDVDRGPLQPGDPLDPPVLDRLVAHPAIEDGRDGLPELVLGILGERLADVLLIDRLVASDQLLEVIGAEVGVEGDAALVLERMEFVLEVLVVDAHGRRAEHVDEPSIAVVSEAGIVRLLGQPLDRGVGQAEVEDRVHHAGHGERGPGPDAHQQRVRRVAELLADGFLHAHQGGLDLGLDLIGELSVALVVIRTDLGGDGESGRDRDADHAHFGEVGPLAAEQFLHLGTTLSRTAAKGVDVLLCTGHRSQSLQVRWVPSPRGIRAKHECGGGTTTEEGIPHNSMEYRTLSF